MCVRMRGQGKSCPVSLDFGPLWKRNIGILNRQNPLKVDRDPTGDESKETQQWVGAVKGPLNFVVRSQQPEEAMLSNKGGPDEGGNCPKRRKFIPNGEKLTLESNCGRGMMLPDGVVIVNKLQLWEGISLVMSEVAAVKNDMGKLSSTLGWLEPNVCRLTDTFIEIKNSLRILKDGGMKYIAADVMKELMERGLSTHFQVDDKGIHSCKEEIDGHVSTDDIGKETEQRNLSPSPIMATKFCHESREKKVDIKVNAVVSERTMNDNLRGLRQPNCVINEDKFPIMGNIQGKDKTMLKFLFRKSGRGGDKSREEVARFGDIGLSWQEIQSLRPKTTLSSKVINISAAYLYEKDSNSWFFPTTFGEIASLEHGQPSLGVSVSSIIDSCGLRRFHRCLKRCTEIFIPLKDDIRDHWFLLVMKIRKKKAELWDCQPDTGSLARRVEKARAAILLLQNVFVNEMTKSRDVYYDFPSFPLSVPEGNPTNDNNHDSGIYVMRHMQSYQEKWFEGYNSHEQRNLLALEIVKHPKNKLLQQVTKAASGRVLRDESGDRPSKYSKTNPATFAGSFKHVKLHHDDQVRNPTGRKCRSHRKRSTRV